VSALALFAPRRSRRLWGGPAARLPSARATRLERPG
jgi:hypothetical protein